MEKEVLLKVKKIIPLSPKLRESIAKDKKLCSMGTRNPKVISLSFGLILLSFCSCPNVDKKRLNL